MSEKNQSELIVITKAKELCCYVMTVTQKSPQALSVYIRDTNAEPVA